MKSQLIVIVAAVVLVACASVPEYSGSYSLTVEGTTIRFQLKSDGSFIGSPEGVNDDAVGTWKVEGDLLVCEGTTAKNSNQITVKFDKTTFKVISLAENGEEAPLDRMIPEGENGIYLRKSQQSTPAPEAKLVEPVAPVTETAKPEPPTAKAPDISIHDAAGEGNIEAVKQHIAAGTDVDAKLAHDPGGITPLIVAAASGHKELAELLIANGADVNATDDGGKTPLDWAFGYLKLETIDLLRKHGGKTGEELKAEGK
ncbi:MAG: ankyrin repeat domain-containing protein [Candidatus Poribacteria bacterium]|nr:ankyrin repeat domain-containing protein [Candidatus Poribacteria bacterium]